jgi:hypothetical protein
MVEAARTSETLVNFYQTTRRYNPEDSHLRTHRRENLKSYKEITSFMLYLVPDRCQYLSVLTFLTSVGMATDYGVSLRARCVNKNMCGP